MSEKSYALLVTGQTVGIEVPASRADRRAWVSVYPYVKEQNRIGVEVEHRYRGTGNPIFHILSFEIEESAVSEPTYDHDQYMFNVRRVDITSPSGIDESLKAVEMHLDSWGFDPGMLGSLSDDYPLT